MRRAICIALLAASPAALACGYCVEDKIAAAYDHAVVARALGQRHHVVFFHVDGRIAYGETARRAIEAAVESAAGVDRGSARLAVQTATLSFAFDPGKVPLATLHQALERKLAARKLVLMPLRVMERPAELRAAGR